MRLLFVVQRYGGDVLGGAEEHARQFATRLVRRGHQVEALTSCARDYLSWTNEYPAGETQLDGVVVHRLPVHRTRDVDLFGRLSERVLTNAYRVGYHLQREWMRLQGPYLAGLGEWLVGRSTDYDVCVFVTYLYYTTYAGIAAARAPVVLIPTAHDEPPLRLALFDGVFQLADAFAFNTEEERDLVHRRFRVLRPHTITGLGVDDFATPDVAGFRKRFRLGDRPYIVYAGRIDISKGAIELGELFSRYKARRRSDLKLVMVGSETTPLPPHRDIVKTGFVDEPTKNAALAGAELLVQPSYFESFSLVLAEAWSLAVPALVQGRCEVLLGQARRSQGGIPYFDYESFEAGLDRLLGDPILRRRMGLAGQAMVRARYRWDAVLDRFESLLERLVPTAPQRRIAAADS